MAKRICSRCPRLAKRGQRYCRVCHTKYVQGWRANIRREVANSIKAIDRCVARINKFTKTREAGRTAASSRKMSRKPRK
jgi:hypothetical protein